jgi:hypothetical protein
MAQGGGGGDLARQWQEGLGRRVSEVTGDAVHPFCGRRGEKLTDARLPVVVGLGRRDGIDWRGS